MEEFPKAPIFLVLNTYSKSKEDDVRTKKRNDAALRIAEKYGLFVIDLYSVSKEHNEMLTADGVHFTQEGYELLAQFVVQKIRENIKFST